MKRLLVLLALIGAAPLAVMAGPQLDEGDVLTLRIAGMADISGDWPVGPGRSLTIPGLGRIDDLADVEDLTARMTTVLAERLGAPGVSFSLVVRSYRPVLVGGAVGTPGPVTYRPGLRVIEAAALAGASGGGIWRARSPSSRNATACCRPRRGWPVPWCVPPDWARKWPGRISPPIRCPRLPR